MVTAALFLESEEVAVGAFFGCSCIGERQLEYFFPPLLLPPEKKLNCDDKDLAIVLKP